MNTVKHKIFNHETWKRETFLKLLKHKKVRKKFTNHNLRDYYFDEVKKNAPIPVKPLDELIDFSEDISLSNFYSRNGNVSPLELMAISAIVAHRKPKRLLEIGTFDGNTTLQMALNCPNDAIVQTLDLPPNEEETKEPVLDSDLQFIRDKKKTLRKFATSSVADKVMQHFGDSTKTDFSLFTKQGSLDLIFIDGGHSYECVKSDTENALKVLAKGGCILWHDFTPHFGGVFEFLCGLSKDLELINIDRTNLVLYQN